MFQKGDIRLDTMPCSEALTDSYGYCTIDGHQHHLSTRILEVTNGVAYLPHSCDEWVIGGVKEVDTMLLELQKVKEKMLRG